MKRIVIVRHAKTVQYGYENDFERDLTEVGKKDAEVIGKKLSELQILPDLIVSSPANRAIQTSQIFAEFTGYNPEKIIQNMDIYEGLTTNEFLKLLQNLNDNLNCIFIFGHNPGFEYFANNLLENDYTEMPTCSTVCIDFKVNSWQQIELRTGKKAFHFIPKMFRK
jgi:phosphohistidine phosphatase